MLDFYHFYSSKTETEFLKDNYTQRVCRRVCRHVCRQVYRQLGPRFSNILSYLESSRMFWNVLKCSECSRMFQNVLYVVNSQCFKLLQIFFVQFFLFAGSRGYGTGGGAFTEQQGPIFCLKILNIGDIVCSEAGSEGSSEGCAKLGIINISLF